MVGTPSWGKQQQPPRTVFLPESHGIGPSGFMQFALTGFESCLGAYVQEDHQGAYGITKPLTFWWQGRWGEVVWRLSECTSPGFRHSTQVYPHPSFLHLAFILYSSYHLPAIHSVVNLLFDWSSELEPSLKSHC